MSEFHAEAPQATASEGLAQGRCVATRAGFELATLWSKGIDSTNAPPCPTSSVMHIIFWSLGVKNLIRVLFIACPPPVEDMFLTVSHNSAEKHFDNLNLVHVINYWYQFAAACFVITCWLMLRIKNVCFT